MTPEEITRHALREANGSQAFAAYTLARWATYGDPAPLPPGWTLRDTFTTPTGIHQLASDPTGRLYRDAPARRTPWTCPAGVTHRRYFRELHRAGSVALFACEHAPDPYVPNGCRIRGHHTREQHKTTCRPDLAELREA